MFYVLSDSDQYDLRIYKYNMRRINNNTPMSSKDCKTRPRMAPSGSCVRCLCIETGIKLDDINDFQATTHRQNSPDIGSNAKVVPMALMAAIAGRCRFPVLCCIGLLVLRGIVCTSRIIVLYVLFEFL